MKVDHFPIAKLSLFHINVDAGKPMINLPFGWFTAPIYGDFGDGLWLWVYHIRDFIRVSHHLICKCSPGGSHSMDATLKIDQAASGQNPASSEVPYTFGRWFQGCNGNFSLTVPTVLLVCVTNFPSMNWGRSGNGLDQAAWDRVTSPGRACLIGGELVQHSAVRVLSDEMVQCRVPIWQQVLQSAAGGED